MGHFDREDLTKAKKVKAQQQTGQRSLTAYYELVALHEFK
jgi:hypothetical protein